MCKISFFRLFLIFVKIGAILLGGGYVILPIIIEEFSKNRNLISQDEILNYFALSQSLPGIIAANISMFIGYKLKGTIGAILAMFGIVFVPFIVIIILASYLATITKSVYVNAIFWGVGIAVIALIGLTVREIWQKSKPDMFFYFIFVFALLTLIIFNLSPIKVIVIFTMIGVLYKYLINFKRVK